MAAGAAADALGEKGRVVRFESVVVTTGKLSP